jgi:hypothetical protein
LSILYIDGEAVSFACLSSRLTVAREMRWVAAISLKLWPWERSWRTAPRSMSSGRRPICLPSSRARPAPRGSGGRTGRSGPRPIPARPESGHGGHPEADHRDRAGAPWSRRSGRCTRRRSENPAAGDGRTGKPLCHFHVDQMVHASPMSYSAHGKQYFAVAAGTDLFSFALP